MRPEAKVNGDLPESVGEEGIYQNRNILRSSVVESASERHSLEVLSSTYVGGFSCDRGSPLHTYSGQSTKRNIKDLSFYVEL